MKKFTFTLQAVLNVKRAQEKQLMGELAVCNARIREFERVQQENYTREQAQHERMKQQLQEGLSPAELRLWRDAGLAVREQIEYQKKVLEQAEDERVRVEKKLIEAMQERKILEKLREKQWDEYRAGEKKEAADEIGEFISNKVGGDIDGGEG